MWESLKKSVHEEVEILREETNKDYPFLKLYELEAQYNEADNLAGEMEAIESRELLLQTKEKSGAKK